MNGRRRLITASVISVQNSNFVYPSCQNCFSRLCVDLKRYSCLKCGCSGDAREAHYRYRLSLEVADAHAVFLVTVFGSCLEAFFGVTAESLQRYIEDLNLEPIRDESPSIVIQAVENCFVGKKFIFGVKESEKQDGAAHWQNYSTVHRYPKALTACQMFLPNPGLVGCTVIHYLHQHRSSSRSEGIRGGLWSPGGLFAALDQPSGDLSGLQSSGDWDAVPSGHTGCLSSLWAQSFGLISSSVSGGTAVSSTALGSGRAACDEQNWDGSPVSQQHPSQSVCNTQGDNRTINERKAQEDKFRLCPTWCDSIIIEEDARSHAERHGSRSLQSPLEREKDSPGIRRRRGLEKSLGPVMCQKQDYSFCPLALCTSHVRDSGSSQDDLWFWDELPSSESLNEFVARIDNGNAMVSSTEAGAQRLFTSKGAGEICKHINQSPLPLDSSTAVQAEEKLQDVGEKVGGSKKPILSCHPSNWMTFHDKEYPPEATSSSGSTQGKDEWEHPPTHRRGLWLPLSLAGMKPSGSERSCPSFREGIDWAVASFGNHCTPLKTAGNFLESPAYLNDKYRSCSATGRKKKGSSCCEPKQTSFPTDVQEQGFTLARREKLGKVLERELFPEAPQDHRKGGESNSFLQGSSIYSRGSYNASVDLFDASTAREEVDIEVMGTVRALPTQGNALPTTSLAPGCNPSELEASWNTTRSGISLLDLFTTCDPKASPLVAGSAFESEDSLLNSQDFVPSSQSTPLVRTCQQASLPRGKKSILSKLPLSNWPWSSAKWKRPRPAFKTPFVKQLISKFFQSRRSSNMISASTETSVNHGLFTHSSPAQESSESHNEEWIPPSEKKTVQPLPFQKQTMFRPRRSRDVVEEASFSEMERRRVIPWGATGLAKTGLTPESQQPPAGRVVREEDADPERVTVESHGLGTFSEGDRLGPSPASKMVNWSSELFGDDSRLLAVEAALRNPPSLNANLHSETLPFVPQLETGPFSACLKSCEMGKD